MIGSFSAMAASRSRVLQAKRLPAGPGPVGCARGSAAFWVERATAGRHVSLSMFDPAGVHRVSLNRGTDTIANVLGTASTSGGNTTVTLHDGSTITFIGISSL